MTLSPLCRFYHFLFRGGWIAETNIIFNGVMEQKYILKYHADIRHQAVRRKFLYVLSAQQNLSFLHIPESGNQVAQSGLSGTG